MSHRRDSGGPGRPSAPRIPFDPVPVRARRNGWLPIRQVEMVEAIARCGCIAEACRKVGMSRESFYELEQRPDAQSFRIACQIAMDYAVRRVGEGALGRAINGVEIPHYYKGELVGTHRRWDERLTMFILRTRDPARFGKHVEAGPPETSPERVALQLRHAIHCARDDAVRETAGHARSFCDAIPAEDDDPAAFMARHLVEEMPPDPGHWDEEGEEGEEMAAGGDRAEASEAPLDGGVAPRDMSSGSSASALRAGRPASLAAAGGEPLGERDPPRGPPE